MLVLTFSYVESLEHKLEVTLPMHSPKCRSLNFIVHNFKVYLLDNCFVGHFFGNPWKFPPCPSCLRKNMYMEIVSHNVLRNFHVVIGYPTITYIWPQFHEHAHILVFLCPLVSHAPCSCAWHMGIHIVQSWHENIY